jgi:alpha,alpha-trehalase
VSRRYLPATNVLETRYVTPTGVLTVVDCLAIRRGAAAGDAAQTRSHHQLLRLVRCEAGQVEVTVEFAPRFDYGLTIPRLELHGDDLGVVYGGADALVLQSELTLVQTEVCGCGATATLRAGDQTFLALTHQLPHQVQVHRLSRHQVLARIDRTVGFWRDWSARCTYDGPYREQVLRSALVLKGLTNAPPAPSSPPHHLPARAAGWGAQLGLPLQLAAGCRHEPLRPVHPGLHRRGPCLHGLAGTHHRRPGREPPAHVRRGWRTAAPRDPVGHPGRLPRLPPGPDRQRRRRPVPARRLRLPARHRLAVSPPRRPHHPTFWRLLAGAVDVVARRWTEPDDGIWEVRGGRRHFVASKVMAWVAVDRAIRLARGLGLPADLDRWPALARAIRRQVEQAGVDPASGAFTQAFGSRALDAANLLLPLVRFLPPDDPRIRATVERTARELAPQGLVHRYLGADDGLPGGEESFVICSFWLVDNLALAGQTDRATVLFERLLGHANDLGLLAEEIDPASGNLLGNFPQAFSHVGLISAAINLQRAGEPTT